MPRPLKVFRTSVGFRDAYVAAPSRAAALRAWGTDKDLFARGGAEEVTDPASMSAALEKPGEVVYRTRGGLKEQVAALGELPARKAKGTKGAETSQAAAPAKKSVAKPRPRPSRAQVDAAEAAIAQLQQERDKEHAALKERERALAAEGAALKMRFDRRLEQLQHKHEAARAAYDEALLRWDP